MSVVFAFGNLGLAQFVDVSVIDFCSGCELESGRMAMNERKTIDLEQGWEFMQKGITKLKNILEGLPEPQFSSEDYMMLYTYLFLTSFFFLLWSFLFAALYASKKNIADCVSLFVILFTEPYTICALKSHHMTIHSSYMTSTGNLLKSTLLRR